MLNYFYKNCTTNHSSKRMCKSAVMKSLRLMAEFVLLAYMKKEH
jgi:hypothetical protein